MMKKLSFKLASVSTLVALPFLGLTSCDSGPVDTGGASTFDLGTRFDAAALEASENEIATMPSFLIQGDSFTHDVPFVLDPVVVEYQRGFQATDEPIVVDASGQYSNAEGESLSNNVNYIYDGVDTFNISEQNSFQATTDPGIRLEFETVTGNILEGSDADTAGSFASAFAARSTNAAASRIYRVGLEATGLIASEAGAIFSLPVTQVNVTQTNLRLNRAIIYEPTSTNAEILASGQISGNVTIRDTYANISINNEDGDRGFLLGLQPVSFIFEVLTLEIVIFTGIQDITYDHQGTFTLNLSSDAF